MADTVAIEWIDGKITTYGTNELRHLRKSGGGAGWLYFNPHSSRYEQVRRIEPISDEVRQRVSAIRSASIAARKSRREQEGTAKLPTHLRLHQIYSR